MAAASSTFQKLLKQPQLSTATRLLLGSLHNTTPQFIKSSPIITLNPPQHTVPTTTSEPIKESIFFPTFPFGYFPNPIFPSGSDQIESDLKDEVGVWADSVKKKRKRKMNKHKYKKLRKRMRGH